MSGCPRTNPCTGYGGSSYNASACYMGVPSLNIFHDTAYTEFFLGFSPSSCKFLDITVNCATTAFFQLISTSLFTLLLKTTTDNYRSRLPSNQDIHCPRTQCWLSENLYLQFVVTICHRICHHTFLDSAHDGRILVASRSGRFILTEGGICSH